MPQSKKPDCINLYRRFHRDYKVGVDPAYEAERLRWSLLNPWSFVLYCKFGTVWPYGGDYLAVDIDYHRKVAKKVEELPGVRMVVDGEDEKTFVFHVKIWDQVAEIVKPKKRRRLSLEQREACAARLTQHRF